MPVSSDRTLTARCVSTVEEASNLALDSTARRPATDTLLMCDPTFFEVTDVKNAFMEGQVDAVDRAAAREQWEALRRTIIELGYPVEVLPGQPGLEDMVFTANQVLVGKDSAGTPYGVLSRMRHPSRRPEVAHFRDWFATRGYRIIELPVAAGEDLYFEAHGDAVWHPGRQLLWGGYGQRTQPEAYELISKLLDVPVVLLELPHPRFYHLDTAFCTLDERSVMIYPAAFDEEGLRLIRHYFHNVVELSDADADNFAGNALALGKRVLLQRGSADACRKLRELGFEPVEVETGEFMKSGGSVFCMKCEIYGSPGA